MDLTDFPPKVRQLNWEKFKAFNNQFYVHINIVHITTLENHSEIGLSIFSVAK